MNIGTDLLVVQVAACCSATGLCMAVFSIPTTLYSYIKKLRRSYSVTELFRLSHSHLLLVPTFVDRGVSRDQRGGSPTVVNLSCLDRSCYFSFKKLLIYPQKGCGRCALFMWTGGQVSLRVVNVIWTYLDSLAFILHLLDHFLHAICPKSLSERDDEEKNCYRNQNSNSDRPALGHLLYWKN
jgi:hypothetical protein